MQFKFLRFTSSRSVYAIIESQSFPHYLLNLLNLHFKMFYLMLNLYLQTFQFCKRLIILLSNYVYTKRSNIFEVTYYSLVAFID